MQEAHKNALAKHSKFSRTMCGTDPDVVQQLSISHAQQLKENNDKLAGLVETVIFCGKQNIPLRDHRDETFKPCTRAASDGNNGNFLALLQYHLDAGDGSVGRLFHMRPGVVGTASYKSNQIQNDLIGCCGDLIQDGIVKRVQDWLFLTVLVDEATAESKKEQMPIVLRYVSQTAHGPEICEGFIGFAECPNGTAGATPAAIIRDHLKAWGLDEAKPQGQGYDGAGNMAGKQNGCAAHITKDYPKALYLHCSSQALNLCSSINLVSAIWTSLREVRLFFNASPKCNGKLGSAMSDDESSQKKLVDLCRT